MDYKQVRAIRRKHRKQMTEAKSLVQTYRIFVTLECGHKTNFSLSYTAYDAGKWRQRRIECFTCASEEIKTIESDPEEVKRWTI